MPAPKGHPQWGGRKKGTPNKATLEKALAAEAELQKAKEEHRPLAKDVLDSLMGTFVNAALPYQPTKGQRMQPEQADNYERWARLAMECAKALAPYQSPTFRAIVVAPAPDDQLQRVTKYELTIFDSQRAATKAKVIEHQPEPKTVNGGGNGHG
jgi:hypothetical protein